VSKVLEGLKTWLQSMNDASASDVVVGETPEKPAEASPPVAAGARLQSGAIVGIFALLVFYFLYFASPILIPIITALLLSMLLGPFIMGLLETKHGEPQALDGDPFVGHREWDISNLAIEVKGIGAFKATGTVAFTNDGKPEKIVLELQRSGNDWRIADIDWDSGNLRSAFRHKAAYVGETLPR